VTGRRRADALAARRAAADRPERQDAARGLTRLCVAAGLAYASYSICRTPLLPLFAQALGAGPAMVGLVVGASTVTGILVKLPAGALSDVLGRRRLLVAGALVFALLPFTYLAVSTLAALLAIRFVHGHATAIFGPVASAAVSDLAPADRRGRWLGAYATAQGVGQTLGPVAAGYLLTTGRFDVAFLVAGAVGLLTPIVVAGLAVDPPPPRPGPRWAAFRDGVREVSGHRVVLVTSGAHAAQFLLNGALNAFLPLYARDVVGVTTGQLGWLFAAQTVTTLVMRPLLGAVSDAVGRRAVIVCGMVLCSAMVGLLPLAPDGRWLAACVVVYALGVATTAAATSALITDVTRRARYGAAHGVFGTIYDVGDAAGPIAAGVLVAALGYGPMFQWLAAVCAAVAALFAWGSRPTAETARRTA
jgi:DHA1 family multidrug resistance protein-like MFS transporter